MPPHRCKAHPAESSLQPEQQAEEAATQTEEAGAQQQAEAGAHPEARNVFLLAPNRPYPHTR